MPSRRTSVLVLFLVAWGLRIVAVLAVQYYLQNIASPPRQFVIEGDADGYWQLAHKLAHGQPYEIYTPPRQVLRMPGFPAILAVSIRLFGDSLLAARLVLATLGAVGCVGVYWLGKWLVNDRVGLIAGSLAAVSPIFVGFSAIELTETAFAVGLVFSLLPLTHWAKGTANGIIDKTPPTPLSTRSAAWDGLVAGLLAGIGCYLRPSWLLFPPCLVLWLWGMKISWPRFVLLLFTVAALIGSLVPWGLRNERLTGHFVLTTLWMGPSLYDGWNPQNTSGDSDMTFFDTENVMSTMSEYEMDRHYRGRAWQFAFQNPGKVVVLAWRKTLRYWNPLPNANQFRTIRFLNWTSVAWFAVVFVPAGIGAWNMRKSWGLLAITLGPIIYFAALHLVFVSSVRYRLPGEYPLLVLTGIGLDTCWGHWTKMSSPSSPQLNTQ